MRRLDFQWKGQLNSEQFQAKYTKEVNRVLLENILPKHVGMYGSPLIFFLSLGGLFLLLLAFCLPISTKF